jgi:hypothetical protein
MRGKYVYATLKNQKMKYKISGVFFQFGINTNKRSNALFARV